MTAEKGAVALVPVEVVASFGVAEVGDEPGLLESIKDNKLVVDDNIDGALLADCVLPPDIKL